MVKRFKENQMSKNEMLEIIWNVKGPNSISPFLPMEFIQEIFDDINKDAKNKEVSNEKI